MSGIFSRADQLAALAVLARPDGDTRVGRGASTVAATLDAVELGLSEQGVELAAYAGKINRALAGASVRPVEPMLIDMHYGALCGTGWLGNGVELGGVNPTPTTATLTKSPQSTSITVADVSIFRTGQLMCYLAPSGQWYSARIVSIAGNVLTLDREMPEGIAAGASVIYFYANDAHPNEWGYRCIADDALRQLVGTETVAHVAPNYEHWAPLGAASVTGVLLPADTTGYLIPGTSDNGQRAAAVVVGDIGQGAVSPYVALYGGAYRTSVALNVGARDGGLSAALVVDVNELRADGVEYTVATRTVAGNVGLRRVDIEYAVAAGSAVRIKIHSAVGGPAQFTVGRMQHARKIASVVSIDHGVHVMHGDSWFASGYLMARLAERLPNATFVNRGIAGNRASDLLARFDADVRSVGQNFTWLMSSTNDYYADVPAPLFEQQMGQLAGLVSGIGSQPIIFNASVGDATYAPVPGERLSVSRAYANGVTYLAAAAVPDGIGARQRTASLSACGLQIAANTTVVAAAIPGRTVRPAALRYLHTSATGLVVRIGYGGVIDDAEVLVDTVTVDGGDTLKNMPLFRSEDQLRYVVVTIENPSGAPVKTSLVADVAWSE